MWFAGAVLGGILAAIVDKDWFFAGAIVGAIAGIVYKRNARTGTNALEGKLAEAHGLIKALEARVHRLERLQDGPGPAREAALTAGSASPARTPIPDTPSIEGPPVDARTEEPVQFDPAFTIPADRLDPPPPTAPIRARGPSALTAVWAWLAGGNPVVRFGVVVLFFGVAFLFKYAYDRFSVPIELRLIAVALGAIAMLLGGWRLRLRRPDYGLVLQGGGVGLLYLVVFGAMKLTGLMPPGLAFLLLAAIAVFSALLAVVQDSLVLAVIGIAGGFLAPVLVSTGQGSHVMLFAYYAVLNAGILGIAWKKAWRGLNVLGFAFTFVIGTIWGVTRYRSEHFATTEPFLVLFFLFYVGIALLYARNQTPTLKHYVDGTLVFGVPVIAFGLQAGLIRHIEFGASFSAATLAIFYIGLASTLFRRYGEWLRLLVESFLALGIVFGTLAIPLALDGRWTSAVWALEGAAIAWIGVKQGRLLARCFGYFLIVAASAAFAFDIRPSSTELPFANPFFMGCVFLSAAGLVTAFVLERGREQVSKLEFDGVRLAMFGWGLLWWVAGGGREIDWHVARDALPSALLVFFTLSCIAFSVAGRVLRWPLAEKPALALLPILVLLVAVCFANVDHPFVQFGYLLWPLAIAAHYWLLRRHESIAPAIAPYLRAGALWLVAVIGSWELGWQFGEMVEGARVWAAIAWAIFPGVLLGLLIRYAPRIDWPLHAHLRDYLLIGAAPIVLFLALWTLFANLESTGNPAPLPYVPLLNPLDLALIAILIVIVAWLDALERFDIAHWKRTQPLIVWGGLGVLAFISINGSLVRSLHHWAAVPFDWDDMFRSRLVQAAFSILWTTLALIATVSANRWRLRALWSAGAGLLILVALKLFFVDFAGHGIERIVSFIGVGVLMVAIGYFAPLPPKRDTQSGGGG